MKHIIAAALVGCLFLINVQAEKLSEKEGYFYEQRPRLGHFKDYPFIDLYKTYAAAFVAPEFPDMPGDDYRNYLPPGDKCMVFFRKFRIDEYVLRDLDDFIVLDACLGYLYESTYHDKDSEASQNVKENLEIFKNDPKLMEIYDNTQISSLSDESKSCIGNLLLDSVRAKLQFKEVVCNNHWLDVFIKFAECQKEIPLEFHDGVSDPYGNALYTLVKTRANECFHNEIHALNVAIRTKYVNNPFERVENVVKSRFRPIRKQAKKRIWPKKITELLTAVQGTNKEINLREVNGIIRGISEDHPNFKQRLLDNLAKYADKAVAPKYPSKAHQKDPTGEERYLAMVDKLCNFFRQSDNHGFYDYSTPFVRMVKMLDYPEIFGISLDYFLEKVLRHSFESGPLYLSVSSCNILTYTEAQFEKNLQNSPLHYKVVFRADTSGMVQWPDAGFY